MVTKAIAGQVAQVPQVVQPHPGEKRHAKLQERESERIKIVRGEIEALDEPSLTALLGELKAQFIARDMSRAVMQRLEDGKWQSALIMGELIRFYWKRTRGTGWSTPEQGNYI